jgi:hypothetical protein
VSRADPTTLQGANPNVIKRAVKALQGKTRQKKSDFLPG